MKTLSFTFRATIRYSEDGRVRSLVQFGDDEGYVCRKTEDRMRAAIPAGERSTAWVKTGDGAAGKRMEEYLRGVSAEIEGMPA